jgi:hypothetical protein
VTDAELDHFRQDRLQLREEGGPDTYVNEIIRALTSEELEVREAETNKLIAKIELCSTCALFTYGFIQCFLAPGMLVLLFEVQCAFITVLTYISGVFMYEHKHLYDFWHPIGLHLVPALWALLVATSDCYLQRESCAATGQHPLLAGNMDYNVIVT